MSKKFLFLTLVFVLSLAYTSYGADTLKPHPISPQTWRFFPAPSGSTSITMQASRCYDSNEPCSPPVWYYYQCTTTGHTDINSGWIQDSNAAYDANTIWTATGLDPNTTYGFKYRARDSADPCNMTNWSVTKSAKTDKNTTPAVLRLDFNAATDNNAINDRPGFTPFIISDSGKTIGGVSVDLENVSERRNPDPCGVWFSALGDANQEYYQRAGETLYQDMIFGISPNGIKVTLWGFGVNQDCNLTLFAYDDKSTSEGNRVAHWFSNGTPIFDTNFIGGLSTSLRNENDYPNDIYKWAYSKRVTADAFGRIVLTSTQAGTPQPFSFMNALIVEPNASITYVPTNYAYHLMPIDNTQDAPIDVVLSWRKGGLSETHDVYLGTDFNDVNDANRNNPLGVLVSQDYSTTAYAPPEFFDLNTTYYWRIDEVNAAPDYTIFEGEVSSFKTLPHFVVENFNSYENDSALQSVWKDGSTNDTSAEVSVETATIRDGNSMKYRYKNNLSPYYSEVSADVNTARPNGLGEDPNWLGTGAKTLALWFYGPSGNEANTMYVKLTDGDVSPHTAQVNYDGDMNDIRDESWREWTIDLQDFVDHNNVNLANVKTITIGFDDGTQAASDGTVYFDDIQLYQHKRTCSTGWAASGDLNGDCVVDYRDLKRITDNWLADCTEPDNCGGADFEPTDGVVNLYDFSDFAMQWLWDGYPPTCDGGYTVPPMPSFSSLPTNPYLPDPFRFMTGSRMTTKAQWPCRRAEIAALAQEFELGYMQYTPYSATTGDFNSISNSLKVTVTDNNTTISFNCSITYPSTGSPPYPAMIGCGGSNLSDLSSLGVAYIYFPNFSIASSSRGAGLFYDMYGSNHSAGSLMAWAWGVSRLIDALEKTPVSNIDPNRLGVTGCSRNGKGALICGAFDERIKLTIPQESGSGGAASWRVSDWQGTTVQTLCQLVTEDVWMRANFNQFCNNTNKLPFDHHMIEGLCAPRALLVIENSSMVWLGNVSTWTTGNVAHKIWEALDIPDTMGYSSVGHQYHCAFPSSQQPELTAYVQKFLVGGGTADTNVMKCDGGVTYNESQWVNWTVPNLR